jgi:hypothetical protein
MENQLVLHGKSFAITGKIIFHVMVYHFPCNGLSFSMAEKIIFPVMEFHDSGCIILFLKKTENGRPLIQEPAIF